jgi:hypothetical protein
VWGHVQREVRTSAFDRFKTLALHHGFKRRLVEGRNMLIPVKHAVTARTKHLASRQHLIIWRCYDQPARSGLQDSAQLTQDVPSRFGLQVLDRFNEEDDVDAPVGKYCPPR